MIHVALFSFQRTTLSFEALASSDSFIVSQLIQLVKNFLNSFWKLLEKISTHPAALPGARSWWPYLSATCIMIQDSAAFVNTLL